jgi:hypothetical protein
MNKTELEKLIEEVIFNQPKDRLTIGTGKGGAREYIKAIDKAFGGNGELTFKKILIIFRNGWIVKENGFYIIK